MGVGSFGQNFPLQYCYQCMFLIFQQTQTPNQPAKLNQASPETLKTTNPLPTKTTSPGHSLNQSPSVRAKDPVKSANRKSPAKQKSSPTNKTASQPQSPKSSPKPKTTNPRQSPARSPPRRRSSSTGSASLASQNVPPREKSSLGRKVLPYKCLLCQKRLQDIAAGESSLIC